MAREQPAPSGADKGQRKEILFAYKARRPTQPDEKEKAYCDDVTNFVH